MQARKTAEEIMQELELYVRAPDKHNEIDALIDEIQNAIVNKTILLHGGVSPIEFQSLLKAKFKNSKDPYSTRYELLSKDTLLRLLSKNPVYLNQLKHFLSILTPDTKPSIDEQYVTSVEMVGRLKNADILINNSEKNIYCLELMLKNNEKLPEFTLSQLMVFKAAKSRLIHFIQYALNQKNKDALTYDVLNIIIKKFHKNGPLLLDVLNLSLFLFKDNELYQEHFFNNLFTIIRTNGKNWDEHIKLFLNNFDSLLKPWLNKFHSNFNYNFHYSGSDPETLSLLKKTGFRIIDSHTDNHHSPEFAKFMLVKPPVTPIKYEGNETRHDPAIKFPM